MPNQKKSNFAGWLLLGMCTSLVACSGRVDSPGSQTLVIGASQHSLDRNRIFIESIQEQVFAGFEGSLFIQSRAIARNNLNLDSFRKTRNLHLLVLNTRELFSVFFPQSHQLPNYCRILAEKEKQDYNRKLPREMQDRLLEEGWRVAGTIIGDGWVIAAPAHQTPATGYRIGIDSIGPDPKVLNALGLAPVMSSVRAMPLEFGKTLDKALVMPLQVTQELVQAAPHLYPAGLEPMPKVILTRDEIRDDLGEKGDKFLNRMIQNSIKMQHSKNLATNKQLRGLWKSWGARLHKSSQNLEIKSKCP